MSSSSSQGEFHSFPHGKDSPQTVRTSSQLLNHCPLPSAKDVSNPVCPSEPQFSSTVSHTSSSLIFPHNHQSSFGLVTCALFLSLLHPHTKADRSGRTHYTRHAPLAFHRVGLFRSDCAEERSWPLATSPRPRRGAGGGAGSRPAWELSTGSPVLKEPRNTHPPARRWAPREGWPQPAVNGDPQLSRGWEGSLGAPLQNVACKLRVGSSSRRQRSEKVLHFSVPPNFQKRVFSPKMGKNLPLQFCHLVFWGFLNLNIFSSLSLPLYMFLVCWGFFRNSAVACHQVFAWQLFVWS